jgi:hypothetical protein
VDDQRPAQKRIKAFKTILEQEKVAVTVRYSRGLAANAACSCIYFLAEIPDNRPLTRLLVSLLG